MLGCLVPNRSELKVKELSRYESWYCGLCQCLKKRHGVRGRLSLSYDMTFLAILLGSLYEDRVRSQSFFCPVHPLRRCTMRWTECSDYCADMNLMLAYYDYLDNWTDERDPAALLQAQALKKDTLALMQKYPRQGTAVREYVAALSACEESEDDHEYDMNRIETAAALTGKMLAEIFDMQEGQWSPQLRAMGFFLGKFIYLSDAYQDIDEDIRSGNYNPLKQLSRKEGFDETCRTMMLLQIEPCCRAFEVLPIVRDAGILRNILYSGVWTGFAKGYRKRKKEAAEGAGR